MHCWRISFGEMQAIKQFFLPPVIDGVNLKLRGIGISEPMEPGIVNRPCGTGDYLLMAFLDPVTIRESAGVRNWGASMVIWDPDQGHYYGNKATPWLHSWMHCDGAAVARLVEDSGLPVNKPFAISDPGIVNHYLWEIYQEVTLHALPKPQIVLNSLHSWLLDMQRQTQGAHETVPAELLALRHYLGENVNTPMRLSDMAERVHMSVSHLSARFKRYFGVAPVEYHIQLRLHAAAYLLRDGNRSIADVARAVGYDDAFYFSKQFKARFRISPSAARKAG